jgi:CrcB protein
MAPGDENEGAVLTPPEEERRKTRLWLGYSADNLRNKKKLEDGRPQSPPEEPSVAPLGLVETAQKQEEIGSPLQPRKSRPSRSSRRESQQTYTLPNDYGNLDELAVPSPVASPQKEREQGYLEERDTRSSTKEKNLDELAAPPPVAERRRNNEEGYLEDRDGSPSTDDTKEKQDVSPRRQRVSQLATQIYTISYLIFFSILGTLARLGLQALTFYPGAPVQTGVLWANVGGSLVMGFLSEDRKLFQEEWGSKPKQKDDDEEKGELDRPTPSVMQKHAAVKKTLPLYIGLATGFCGSFTSFSSFMRDSFFALSNALHVPISHPSSAPISEMVNVHRNGGYSFLAVLAVLITTVGLSLMALQFGAHTALFLEPWTPSIPFLFARKIVDRSVVFLGWGCWLGAIFLAIFPPDRPGGPVGDASLSQETWRSQALFALVFAPLGCLLRFYASLHLNGRIKAFPLGTFVVNVFGTAMEAMFLDLQRVPIGGMIGCQVLQGMADGFCGCLTTVSTWVAELTALRLKHAYFYGLMSVGVGLSLMIVIMGSLQWTNGFQMPLCMS